MFEEFGEVVDVRVQSDRETGLSRGFAYVDLACGDRGAAALASLEGVELFEGPLEVHCLERSSRWGAEEEVTAEASAGPAAFSAPSLPSTAASPSSHPGDLYVSNLPKDVVAADIVRVFGNFGAVQDVRMGAGPGGRPLGFAYVTMSSLDDARGACEGLRGYVWAGSPIYVQPSSSFRKSPK